MASSTDTSGMEYEVFLSFRGSDTRDNFTSVLYEDMVEKGIRVFKDDKELQAGEEIKELFKALDDSQIYIPIFSQDFASSTWCLEEVARMLDRTSELDGKKEILPIFLDVKPEDVKSRKRLYSKALSEHEKERDPAVVKRWREALREVTSRVGWKLEGKELGKLVKSIVREVLLKLKLKNRSLPDKLVQMDDEEDIEKLLEDDSADDVRFVKIHGTGGIGKTTLASVIFNRFRSEFDCSSFLEDVQDLSQRHGLLHVQKKLLSDTLGSISADGILDTNDGINRIKNGLSSKKVLVVVDNVNEKKQLENLARNYTWFGPGSRIIVTVRDRRTIIDNTMPDEDKQTRPSYYMDYPMKEMPLDRAIQLFSKHAFRSDTPPKDWHNFSVEVVSSIGRLPLTLEVVGSLFARTVRSEWSKTLKDLKQVPCDKVRDTLMISFNNLDNRKKDIFLDIACFCIGEDKTHAYYMWDDCGYSPHSAIDDLLLMSLIKIDEDNKFQMHDEVRDLGRYIVKEEDFEDAGKRRWVWIDENTLHVLRSNEEKPSVRALSLGISHDFTPKELARFPNLRFLGGERMNFVGNFKNLLLKLKWLSWHHCPLNLRAKNLHPVNLVVFDLSWSDITHKWGGWRQIKMGKKLKVLDLGKCRMLTQTPDFSEFGELEKLIIDGCTSLSTIDGSIGKLKLLSSLILYGCNYLRGLPEEIGSLECLSEISLILGHKEFKLPETLGNLKSLTRLQMYDVTALFGSPPGVINQLPRSIGRLTNLTHLILNGCNTIYELPDSIGELESLIELNLRLLSISVLPDSIGNLKRLKFLTLDHSKIQTIPCALGRVETLEVLNATDLCLEDEIPWQMWSLTRLRSMGLSRTPISTLPPKLSGFSSLQKLQIEIAGHQFCPLPEFPLSLKRLEVQADELTVLPDLSSLVHLDYLDFWIKNPASWSANEVISPREEMPSITWLPPNLSTLILDSIPQLSDFSYFKSLSVLAIRNIPRLPDFSYFKSLSVLTIGRCWMTHFPVLKSLERLRELSIHSCFSLESTPDLSGLKGLEELHLLELPELAEIPGLGELESLKFLHIRGCEWIRQLPNLSKLKNLRLFNLFRCHNMRAVEGLKELNSLRKVEITKCRSLERLPDLPTSTKLETDWMPPEAAEDAEDAI